MAPTATTAAPPVQPEILDFVERNGLGAYLEPVLAMTRRHFPHALTVELSLEEDPEIPGDEHLLVRVCLPGLDAEHYVASKFQWGHELFRICPAPLVCAFRCRLCTDEP